MKHHFSWSVEIYKKKNKAHKFLPGLQLSLRVLKKKTVSNDKKT